MNSREKKIFLSLFYQKEFVPLEELAKLNDISLRSIYNDLNKIDEFLIKSNLPPLERVKGKGVRYLVASQSLEQLNDILLLPNQGSYLEPEIRRKRLVQSLLFKSDYVTIDGLSNLFLVSRNTIVNDIQLLKEFFEGQELLLVSYPYRGLKVEGSELAKRKAMVSLYSKSNTIELENPNQFLSEFLTDSEITNLEKLLLEIENELNLRFTDVSYNEFKLYLAMTIHRNRKNKYLDFQFKSVDVSQSREYQIITLLNQKIIELFDLSFSHDEISYLSLQLMSSSIQTDLSKEGTLDIWVPLQLGVYEFIQGLEEQLELILAPDDLLFQGLLAHIRPAYYRVISGETIENPIFAQIRADYPDIHQAVLTNIKWLELHLKIIFPEEELSFITMYVAGAIERKKKFKRVKPRLVIVCSSGISTSQMLVSKITNRFDVTVVGASSSRDVSELLAKYEIDLIVSTIDMTHEEIKVLKVSPLLEEQDIARLRKYLSTRDTEIDLERLMAIIESHATITQKAQLATALSNYLHPNPAKESYKGAREPMLIEVLNENLIAVQQQITNKEDAVRKCGELLYNNQLIELTYIDAMIDNLRENGNYIVIAPGIAMPHARPEFGVKDIGFSLVTLAEPIKFGHQTNDPVQIIFGLCAVDHQSHLQALSELVEILAKPENVQQIIGAQTATEVMKIIKESV